METHIFSNIFLVAVRTWHTLVWIELSAIHSQHSRFAAEQQFKNMSNQGIRSPFFWAENWFCGLEILQVGWRVRTWYFRSSPLFSSARWWKWFVGATTVAKRFAKPQYWFWSCCIAEARKRKFVHLRNLDSTVLQDPQDEKKKLLSLQIPLHPWTLPLHRDRGGQEQGRDTGMV